MISVGYLDVQEITTASELIILKNAGKELVYFNRNGFIDSSDKECLDY